MQKTHVQMTQPELRAEIDRLSRWLAFGRYQKQHPGASDEEASAYAHRSHHLFVDAAIDVLIAGACACENN